MRDPGTLPKKFQIVLAEDDPRYRRLLCDLLKLKGYDVWGFGDGDEVCHFVREFSGIDLLLTDLSMLRMGGGELIRKMGALLPHLPVIVITGECDAWEQYPFSDSPNVREVLIKPVPIEILFRKVETVLSNATFPLLNS